MEYAKRLVLLLFVETIYVRQHIKKIILIIANYLHGNVSASYIFFLCDMFGPMRMKAKYYSIEND